MLADLDTIIRGFLDQLQTATADGWHRTRPDHYRALLAALESALSERREGSAAQVGVDHGDEQGESYPVVSPCGVVVALSEARSHKAWMPFASRWSWRPLLSPLPVSRGH